MMHGSTLLAVVGAAALTAGANAGWMDRAGAAPRAEVLDTLAALDIDTDAIVRATVDADGVVHIERMPDTGDALTVQLRVGARDGLAAMYRRLTGAPLHDWFSPAELAAAINWAILDPERFIDQGGSMNDLRQARIDAAQRSLTSPSSAPEFAGIDDRPVIDGASSLGASQSVPAPGGVAAIGIAGALLGCRRRR